MRSRPRAPLTTGRTALAARGSAARLTSTHGCPATARATTATKGSASRTTYSTRVRRSPIRTANVFLPTTRSVGTSRRLLATSRAHARQPMATAHTTDTAVTRPTWTYVVPHTATSP